MANGLTCLVTIHGIGFQQPPMGDVPGYADGLHQRLRRILGDELNDDPGRQRSQPGEAGPVYVQSSWPPGSNNLEAGLERLGTVVNGKVDGSKAPLGNPDGIAHIALVYSRLQDDVPRPGASLELAARTALSLSHYASVVSAFHCLIGDVSAMIKPPQRDQATPSLQPRTDNTPEKRHMFAAALSTPAAVQASAPATPAPTPKGTSGVFDTVRHLEDDVAAYVARNDLRERVRSFVQDALLRLAGRDDVTRIVINSHSQGTVLSFDVLRELSFSGIPKVKAFVTNGSPLRKYTDMFCWGNEVGCIKEVPEWINYWDPKDPVADPLFPQTWQPGGSANPAADGPGLYQALDAQKGTLTSMAIKDQRVDNLQNSVGGGLQAHNYWDNDLDVVKPLASMLQEIHAGTRLVERQLVSASTP